MVGWVVFEVFVLVYGVIVLCSDDWCCFLSEWSSFVDDWNEVVGSV